MRCNENGLTDSDYYFFTPSEFYERFGFYVTVCGDFHARTGYGIRRNGGVVPLLFLLGAGEMDFTCEGRSFRAHAGQLVLLNCERVHSYRVPEHCDFLFFHFSGETASEITDRLIATNDSILFDPPDAERMLSRAKALLCGLHEKRPPSEADLSSFLYETLCHLYQKGVSDLMQKDSTQGSMSKVLSYIRAHIREDLTLEMLSQVSSMSKYHFLRCFKKEIGVTPFQYIGEMRVSLSQTMLTATNMSIAQIAYDLGYSNESAFIRAFTRVQGISPGKFRKRTR